MGMIVELSANVNGRRTIKFILHEIFENETLYQNNGISWNEEYTGRAMSTVEGMSVKAQFLDVERKVPFAHGMTGIQDGKPVFDDAVVLGHAYNAQIETVEVNGRSIKALTAEAELDDFVYGNFIGWMETEISAGNTINGSVEIFGAEPDKPIGYRDGYKELGRVPMDYIYGGYAIISVEPADETAVLLELNQKEELRMDKEFADAFGELQTKIEALHSMEAKITEMNALKAELEAKTLEATELRTGLDMANAKIAEYESKMAGIEKQAKINELNAALKDFEQTEIESARDLIDAYPDGVELESVVQKIKAAKYDMMIAETNARSDAPGDMPYKANLRPLDYDFSDLF